MGAQLSDPSAKRDCSAHKDCSLYTLELRKLDGVPSPSSEKIEVILLMDKILHHLTTLPWKGRIATPVAPSEEVVQCWRDPSEEVVQDFGPSTCFCFLTVVATMLTRENEGSKKSVRKVVQDFVHQQSRFITTVSFQ